MARDWPPRMGCSTKVVVRKGEFAGEADENGATEVPRKEMDSKREADAGFEEARMPAASVDAVVSLGDID